MSGKVSFLVVTALFIAMLSSCAPPPPPPAPHEIWPTRGWIYSTPEAEGIDPRVLANAVTTIRAERLPVHSLFVERNGHVVLDAYFYPYSRDETHDFASVTKSVLSTVVGIARHNDRIGGLETTIAELLPDELGADTDPRKRAITLAELLSMTSGLDCSAAPGENLLREMEQTPDWVAFMLSRPLAAEPGARFQYCGGAMHIVSAALTRALGQNAFAYAEPELFAPLGVSRSVWPADPRGNSYGFADLELFPEDAAKLGYLWLHHGKWDNEQIVGTTYLEQALMPRAQVEPGIAYGFGFWLYPAHRPYDFEANGRGGQRITVVPSQNLVEVVTAGGADANRVAQLLAGGVRSGSAIPTDAEGEAQLAAAVADAAHEPSSGPVACVPPPSWARSLGGIRLLVSDNPLGLRALELTFAPPCQTFVGLGFSEGSFTLHPVGMSGIPFLSPDPGTGHRVAISGAWSADSFDLDYDEVARIDDYRLMLTPAGQGLRIHLTERTGLVDVTLFAVPR